MSIGVRCLITGGTGFVGANLVRRLVADGHECHLILRPQHSDWRLQSIRAQLGYHIVGTTSKDELRDCLESIRPDWIFHLAANGAYSWQNDPQEIFATNFFLLNSLLETSAMIGFKAFVNAGSSSEYGFKDHPPTEDDLLEPNSYYAIAKAAATHLCQYLAQSKRLPIATLRLYSVYGPYEDPGRLIPTIIREGLKGKLPPLVAPDVARDYIYIDDVCQAFICAAIRLTETRTEPRHELDEDSHTDLGFQLGTIFNVGSGKQTTIREVVELAKNLMSIEECPVWGTMENRRWDTASWVANAMKAKEQLGWQAQTSFAEGLQKTIDWTRQQNETLPGELLAKSSQPIKETQKGER